MKNRNKTYAKGMLAMAIGFSFAAEVTNYTFNKNKTSTEEQIITKTAQKQEVQEKTSASRYQDKLSFWE
ncbi:hypothetical protein DXT99_20610 [Pontibacter diazotrophicus]|uniref:Uncharacterized protein n=1 Tax=Pontibacter diazotrophicus TaxID=1400979 RepID=A0A3D8L7C7_9BACT|nr:hypothetical protein [Pontibacter diazotrophicus]RDV13277.1 hypothetical protein DXT99_20610 [Pontibacter diazotrophicus]